MWCCTYQFEKIKEHSAIKVKIVIKKYNAPEEKEQMLKTEASCRIKVSDY